jgi:hypothetical protein
MEIETQPDFGSVGPDSDSGRDTVQTGIRRIDRLLVQRVGWVRRSHAGARHPWTTSLPKDMLSNVARSDRVQQFGSAGEEPSPSRLWESSRFPPRRRVLSDVWARGVCLPLFQLNVFGVESGSLRLFGSASLAKACHANRLGYREHLALRCKFPMELLRNVE